MPDMLVRNIKPETMAYLKRKAAARGHTVQDEVRAMLDESRERETNEKRAFQQKVHTMRERLRATGADFGDSTADIREDRDTDHGRG